MLSSEIQSLIKQLTNNPTFNIVLIEKKSVSKTDFVRLIAFVDALLNDQSIKRLVAAATVLKEASANDDMKRIWREFVHPLEKILAECDRNNTEVTRHCRDSIALLTSTFPSDIQLGQQIVGDLKTVMDTNLDLAIQEQNSLAKLVDKAKDLENASLKFKSSARKLAESYEPKEEKKEEEKEEGQVALLHEQKKEKSCLERWCCCFFNWFCKPKQQSPTTADGYVAVSQDGSINAPSQQKFEH